MQEPDCVWDMLYPVGRSGHRAVLCGQEPRHGDVSGTGFGLAASGVISIIRNLQYLRNPELKEKRRIYETDERNRMLGLRCWAYTGYTMMLMLYIGVLVSGFISMTVAKTLIFVAALFAVLLLVFRGLLQKVM